MKYVFLCVFLIVKSFNQNLIQKEKKLFELFSSEKYTPLIQKASALAQSSRGKNRPLPYFYWAAGLYYKKETNKEEKKEKSKKNKIEKEISISEIGKIFYQFQSKDQNKTWENYSFLLKEAIKKNIYGEMIFLLHPNEELVENGKKLSELTQTYIGIETPQAGILFFKAALEIALKNGQFNKTIPQAYQTLKTTNFEKSTSLDQKMLLLGLENYFQIQKEKGAEKELKKIEIILNEIKNNFSY